VPSTANGGCEPPGLPSFRATEHPFRNRDHRPLPWQHVAVSAKRFSAEILGGHKENAVEVPFDPAAVWGGSPVAIRPGRRGYAVEVVASSARFESFVVARSRRHWLLLNDDAMRVLGAKRGDVIAVALAPREDVARSVVDLFSDDGPPRARAPRARR
jgi:hypothetical protein